MYINRGKNKLVTLRGSAEHKKKQLFGAEKSFLSVTSGHTLPSALWEHIYMESRKIVMMFLLARQQRRYR